MRLVGRSDRGLINGVLIAYAKLTPILCTLGTQLIFTGFAVVISHGSGVKIGFIEPLSFIGDGLIANIPFCFALFILLATLLGLWLRFSATGIRLYLLGTNLKAAQYIGIAQQRLLVVIYTLSGTLAAIAGIIIAARSTSATADYGSSYVLIAILIAVMAGVRPEGDMGEWAAYCYRLPPSSFFPVPLLFWTSPVFSATALGARCCCSSLFFPALIPWILLNRYGEKIPRQCNPPCADERCSWGKSTEETPL